MVKPGKTLLWVLVSLLAVPLIALAALWAFVKWEYHLPSEARVRQQFRDHRAAFARFVLLVRKNHLPGAAAHVSSDGVVTTYAGGVRDRVVPEFRNLAHDIGAREVIIREDGSVEFEMWGSGCAICSDSYMGIRYYPADHTMDQPGWSQVVVPSLESSRLPQEGGDVATGLYVSAIEPEWFAYRFEYQE